MSKKKALEPIRAYHGTIWDDNDMKVLADAYMEMAPYVNYAKLAIICKRSEASVRRTVGVLRKIWRMREHANKLEGMMVMPKRKVNK